MRDDQSMMNRKSNGARINAGNVYGVLTSPPSLTSPKNRIQAIDFARGIAVSLMILSHGVNGLMPFEDFPDWGRHIHLITKFSSSLFIIVFGIALAIAYLPHVNSEDWHRRKTKMILTGFVIFFWYKVLTIVEMVHFFDPSDIVDTLLFRSFPSYVEILGFYAIALIWAPFLLMLWKKTPLVLRLLSPLLIIAVNQILARYFNFWGIEQIEAILIGHEDHHAWGQIARAPLILSGLLLGELIVHVYNNTKYRIRVSGILAAGSMIMFLVLYMLISSETYDYLIDFARNVGKHPPQLRFMLFSVGGAILILSLALIGGERLASILRPITIIGTNALMAFIFHIFVIFAVFRYLLGYWGEVSYDYALTLALLLIPATAIWIKLTSWVKKYR